MGRLLFVLPSVGAGDTVRIDTASGSNTPASIAPASGGPAITGAVLHAGADGALPRVLGPADGTDTLYLKQLNYRGLGHRCSEHERHVHAHISWANHYAHRLECDEY
jgi:hypothetical protein